MHIIILIYYVFRYAQVEKMLKENKQFQESLKKRGIKNMDLVNIDVWSVGW